MSKGLLIVWLTLPLLAVGILWMFTDRNLGRPDRMLAGRAESVLAPAAGAAADDSNRGMAAPGAGKAANAAGPGAKMVQPEDLPQGFIVVVTDKTRKANSSSPIFMPSSHNGWNPGDPKMKLEAQSDMRWRIVWEKPTLDSRIAFKFARGSWELVETDANFKDIDNRMLPMVDVSKLQPGEKPVIELEVVAWKDSAPADTAALRLNRYHKIEVGAGTTRRIEVTGGGIAGLNRDVIVWLPPGYDDEANAHRSYPVLYLNDGQNVFEKLPTIPAEWQVDETAGRLIAAGKVEPLIIVAIPHAGAGRSQEYLPIEVLDNTPARGHEYVEFVINEVMPRVERAFRVKTGPENTGIGGASLGGVISLEAGTSRPNVFGKVLAESTPLAIKQRALFRYFAEKKNWPQKLYFGFGAKEAGNDPKDAAMNEQYAASATAFRDLMAGKGMGPDRFRFVLEEGAVHNEEAWARRFGPALEFLYPAGK